VKYSEYKNVLKSHDLRVTDCRIDVLERFNKSSHALSFKDLEDALSDDYDRVTLYRTLHSFIENGVLHKIPNDDGMSFYGLCFDTCTSHGHKHDHVHFKCLKCGNVDCIPDEHVPVVTLPGYKIVEVNVVVNGYCKDCQKHID